MNRTYQEVNTIFSELERLYTQDPALALKGMIDLYADAVFNHEVADAIGMWVSYNLDDVTIEYLQSIIDEEKSLSKVYVSWLANAKS